MATPPDPAALERIAAAAERAALEYEQVGRNVMSRTRGMVWTAPRAERFHAEMGKFNGLLNGNAENLRDIATSLRKGAADIRAAQKK